MNNAETNKAAEKLARKMGFGIDWWGDENTPNLGLYFFYLRCFTDVDENGERIKVEREPPPPDIEGDPEDVLRLLESLRPEPSKVRLPRDIFVPVCGILEWLKCPDGDPPEYREETALAA